MALNKRTYTDFDEDTPITAQNLNDIQDEVIASLKVNEAQNLSNEQKMQARRNIGLDYTIISTYS